MYFRPMTSISFLSTLTAALLLASGSVAEAQLALTPRGPSGPTTQAAPSARMASLPNTGAPRSFRYGAMEAGASPSFRTTSYVPPHERAGRLRVVSESTEMVEGTVMHPPQDGEIIYEGMGHTGHGGCADGSCGSCGPGCHGRYIPCPTFTFRSLQVMSGVQGFKNGGNRGSDGSFGFQEGLNWMLKFPCFEGINGQVGVRGVQSDLAGSALSTDSRNQLFVTAGLFRRVDWGWQFGAVVDFLREDWYTEMNLSQVRGEVSWVFPAEHELGFRISQSANLQTNPAIVNINGVRTVRTETWEATDTYLFFYRYRSEMMPTAGGELFVGLSNESDTLFGANLNMPFSPWVAVQSDFTYLLPPNKVPAGGNPGESEGWNIGVGLVFYPGGPNNFSFNRYDRPLFGVANNGNFITDRRRP